VTVIRRLSQKRDKASVTALGAVIAVLLVVSADNVVPAVGCPSQRFAP
jgi:hypothetical protein